MRSPDKNLPNEEKPKAYTPDFFLFFTKTFFLAPDWVFGGLEWVSGGLKWVFGGMEWVFGGMEWVFQWV